MTPKHKEALKARGQHIEQDMMHVFVYPITTAETEVKQESDTIVVDVDDSLLQIMPDEVILNEHK